MSRASLGDAPLWLLRAGAHRQGEAPRSRKIRLRTRFAAYPHFEAMLDEYAGMNVPDAVMVRWVPIESIVQAIPVHSGEDAQRERAFIAELAQRMRQDDDIPPVLLRGGVIHDGRHRALAGQHLGLHHVPVVDIDPYWDEAAHEAPAHATAGSRRAQVTGRRRRNPAAQFKVGAQVRTTGPVAHPFGSLPELSVGTVRAITRYHGRARYEVQVDDLIYLIDEATLEALRPVGSSTREKMVNGSVATKTLLGRDCVPERGATRGTTLCYEHWKDNQGHDWVERQRNPTEISPGVMLTDKQAQALHEIQEAAFLHQRPRSLWDYGSTTISRLRKLGLITTRNGFAYPVEPPP